MGNKLDLTNLKFGKLTAIKCVGINKWKRTNWLCKCECGNEIVVDISHLRAKDTKSCGCLFKEVISKLNKTHGCTINGKTPEYRIWNGIKTRCLNKKGERYKDYGGRGIVICGRWVNSFENFLNDMGERPSPKFSIDRYPNINGNYEPSNCRWATNLEQSRGQRTNRWIEYNNKKMILEDWAKEISVSPDSLAYHLRRKSMKEAIDFFDRNRHKNYKPRIRIKLIKELI